LPFALSCAIGSNLSVSTPLATTAMTLILETGYRVKDYLRFGGVMNIVSIAVVSVMMYVFYFA
ncbi:MAG: hypothetical protein IJF29_05965, partial [Firmicutes bacterium]|nr:hypothetical protein [Bacillota bacterium]